ncbi:MAG: hypothetical protein ACO1N0_17670 [Fluviicola sp.]
MKTSHLSKIKSIKHPTSIQNGLLFLLMIVSSCSYHTDVSYRLKEKEEWIKKDGFIISCVKDGNSLIVETFTPESTIPEYYYEDLEGKRSTRKVKISGIRLFFMSTSKKVTPVKRPGSEVYYYTSKNLQDIIDENESIKLIFHLTDLKTGKHERIVYVLKWFEKTYSSGTFPHS